MSERFCFQCIILFFHQMLTSLSWYIYEEIYILPCTEKWLNRMCHLSVECSIEEQNFHLLKVKALFSILHLFCQFSFSHIQNCTIIFISSAVNITVIIYYSCYGHNIVTILEIHGVDHVIHLKTFQKLTTYWVQQ